MPVIRKDCGHSHFPDHPSPAQSQEASAWHVRAIPITPITQLYSESGQFLGGGTCSNDSSHDSMSLGRFVLWAGRAELAKIPNPRLSRESVHSLGVILEIHETVAVIQFDFQQLQHRKSQKAGNFRPCVTAQSGEVQGNDLQVRLSQMPETQSGLVGTVDLLYLPVQTTNPQAVVGTHLADLPPGTHRENVREGTRVEPE